MDEIKTKLINKAQEMYSNIYPCGNNVSFVDCFTICENDLIFWFNTDDNSTHLLKTSLD
ncbi:MAG: hypothetical protein Q4F84_00890 [Fibrobacter sp.]|nr:hypothetical protein [Fibrobacter sp.]